MIGILILLCGTGGLAISVLAGMAGIAIHRKTLTAAGGGSWLGFWVIAAVVALIVIAMGVLQIHGIRGGAPRPEDYSSMMKAAFLFGAAPGLGMLAGTCAALFR
ncbi:MAG TPA: hypothetical protein VF267_12260 [Gammaproteobacteria bacterium]